MRKILLVVLCIGVLAGCQKPVNEWKQATPLDLKTIKGLEDCSYSKFDTGEVRLHVVRCPNSTVSTKTSGKHPVHTITIDGTEYVQKQ